MPTGRRDRPVALPALGVDVGGVIVDRAANGSDTSFFGDRPLETPAVPGAVAALARIVPMFAGRVYVVSKAGPRTERRTRAWFEHTDFHEQTGILRDHVHFVRERREKAPVAARLALTAFVDDRVDVLAHLADLPDMRERYVFTGGSGEDLQPPFIPSDMIQVESWPELERLLSFSTGKEKCPNQ